MAAAKTPTEKINDLTILVAQLAEQVKALREEVQGADAERSKLAETVAEQKTKIALVEQHLSEMRKDKDEWGRRIWLLIVAGAAGLIGYFLRRP